MHMRMPKIILAARELERPNSASSRGEHPGTLLSALAELAETGAEMLESLPKVGTIGNRERDHPEVVIPSDEIGTFDVAPQHLAAATNGAERAEQRNLAEPCSVQREPVAVVDPLAEPKVSAAGVEPVGKALVIAPRDQRAVVLILKQEPRHLIISVLGGTIPLKPPFQLAVSP